MDGTIGYLEALREDLLDAGMREGRRDRRGTWRHGLHDRFSARSLVAVAAAITLLAAGSVGWFVTRGDDTGRRLALMPGEAGATGATGATGPAGTAVPATADEQGVSEQFGHVLDTDAGVTVGLPSEVSRVIRTAELGLIIPRGSFDDRFAEAVDVAETSGGFVATSTTRERSGGVTMRVPAARFNEALASLRELGEVDVQTVEGRDVTAEYVDLQARLRIAEARRAVLLALMDQARSIQQTIRVQNALDDTQLRIEELQGQENLLDDRTSLATIRLRMREEGVEPTEVETPSLPNALERAVAGFVGMIAAIVIGIGYVIPFLLIALVAWFVVVRVRRRRGAV